MPRKRTTQKSKALTPEQRKLAQLENELQRKEEALRKLIEEAPKRKEALERQRQKEMKLRAQTMSSRREVPGVLRDARFGDAPQPRRKRTLQKERRASQFRFMILCIVLLSILILLWRALPV